MSIEKMIRKGLAELDEVQSIFEAGNAFQSAAALLKGKGKALTNTENDSNLSHEELEEASKVWNRAVSNLVSASSHFNYAKKSARLALEAFEELLSKVKTKDDEAL